MPNTFHAKAYENYNRGEKTDRVNVGDFTDFSITRVQHIELVITAKPIVAIMCLRDERIRRGRNRSLIIQVSDNAKQAVNFNTMSFLFTSGRVLMKRVEFNVSGDEIAI